MYSHLDSTSLAVFPAVQPVQEVAHTAQEQQGIGTPSRNDNFPLLSSFPLGSEARPTLPQSTFSVFNGSTSGITPQLMLFPSFHQAGVGIGKGESMF